MTTLRRAYSHNPTTILLGTLCGLVLMLVALSMPLVIAAAVGLVLLMNLAGYVASSELQRKSTKARLEETTTMLAEIEIRKVA